MDTQQCSPIHFIQVFTSSVCSLSLHLSDLITRMSNGLHKLWDGVELGPDNGNTTSTVQVSVVVKKRKEIEYDTLSAPGITVG